MKDSYTISMIGAGNVAWHLAQDLEANGHHILEVYSRDIQHANDLAKHLYDAQTTNSLDFSRSEAELLFVCVPDDTIEEVIAQLSIPSTQVIVAHVSGSMPLQVLSTLPCSKGVFYPLQTFSKDVELQLNNVPFCIEANDDDTQEVLEVIAKSISKHIYPIDSQERMRLHLAAVFACNFSNHMMAIAQNLLSDYGLEWEMMKPLINETLRKSLEIGPYKAQTGPAIRNDEKVIIKHKRILESYPEWLALYRGVTQDIQNTHE